MLRAKSRTSLTKRKARALEEVLKDDDKRAVYAKISKKDHKRLRVALTTLEMTFDEWLTEKIGELR